jgi:hypothetical protein
MSAHLLIPDSSLPYWWVSSNIWVVPGDDPNGPPGSPIAGLPAYLWARVSNTGNVAAKGTRVDFYWANPSAQVVAGVATKIGSAFVDLTPGDTQEVLCLVPWVPVIVNGGHECLLAVAHGPGDTNPIPDPLPNGYPFDPPSHDQIAQLNLSVLSAGLRGSLLSLNVNAIVRGDKHAHLAVEFGREVDERVLTQLGLHDLRPAQRNLVEVSLARKPRCDERPDPQGMYEMEVHVPRGTWVPVFVAINAQQLRHNEYQLVHIVERNAGKIVGGVSYLIVNQGSYKEEQS